MATTNTTAVNGTAATARTTFSRTTSIQINIAANKSTIWAILTNASDFARWNSTVISLEGNIIVGEKIKLRSTVDESRTFNLKVQSMNKEKEMIWSDGMAPFFKGVRTYQLTDNSDGTVTFSMNEKLAGIMFALAAKHIPEFDASFEAFAADLKKEAESK